jgi:NAD/NADP transhydrogenase alpha subunit
MQGNKGGKFSLLKPILKPIKSHNGFTVINSILTSNHTNLKFSANLILRRIIMKSLKNELIILSSKMTAQKVRLVVFVLTLAMFAVAAGAPANTGGVGH